MSRRGRLVLGGAAALIALLSAIVFVWSVLPGARAHETVPNAALAPGAFLAPTKAP